MPQQLADIADLVKPKFRVGQTVYRRFSDAYGLESVRRAVVEEVRFTVYFKRNRSGGQYRESELVYNLISAGQAFEESLFASPEEATRGQS